MNEASSRDYFSKSTLKDGDDDDEVSDDDAINDDDNDNVDSLIRKSKITKITELVPNRFKVPT